MTDRDIPKQCRTCELCKRYIEIPAYLPLYDWESFGFSTNDEPSDDELIEWLGNIFINKTDVDDIDPDDWFAIPEF